MREVVLFEVFLYLHKAYYTLYWDRCLGILAAYGVIPSTIQLLRTYWVCLHMVSRGGEYFWILFKGYRGVIQGNPLSPTVFKMVVDAVIRYWVEVVVPTEDGTEGLGMLIQDLAAYLYANDGLIASTHLERLQRAFDVLAVLFERVSLRTNTRKTVNMACQPCHASGQMS